MIKGIKMKNIPQTIYLQLCEDKDDLPEDFNDLSREDITWSDRQESGPDLKYKLVGKNQAFGKPIITFVEYKEKGCFKYDVIFNNGVNLGFLYQEMSDDFVYVPELHDGFWDSMVMHIIADKLDDLNLAKEIGRAHV